MKSSLLSLTLLALAPLSGMAAEIYLTDNFNNLSIGAVDDNNLHGQNGWVINDVPTIGSPGSPTNPTDLSFRIDPTPVDGNIWGGLGGATSYPTMTNVTLSHATSVTLDKANVSLDFSIFESSSGLAKDYFGWTLKDSGGANIFTIKLSPYGSPVNTGLRQISFYFGAGAQVPTTSDVLTGNSYHLNLDFVKSGSDILLNGTVGPYGFNGTIASAATASIGSIAANFTLSDPAPINAGDNYMIFDNVYVIPEPSSALMLGLTALAGVRRRRR